MGPRPSGDGFRGCCGWPPSCSRPASPVANSTETPIYPAPAATSTLDTSVDTRTSARLIQPTDLVYLGAFRLPDESAGIGWEYSGARQPWGHMEGVRAQPPRARLAWESTTARRRAVSPASHTPSQTPPATPNLRLTLPPRTGPGPTLVHRGSGPEKGGIRRLCPRQLRLRSGLVAGDAARGGAGGGLPGLRARGREPCPDPHPGDASADAGAAGGGSGDPQAHPGGI